MSKEALEEVMAQEPDLTILGFGYRPGVYAHMRAHMLEPHYVAQFERATQYLSQVKRSEEPTMHSASLQLNMDEYFASTNPDASDLDDHLVSQGAILAAAIHLGFQVKRIPKTDDEFSDDAKYACLNVQEPLPH